MKMSNKTYDILKDIALYVMPALATLILTLGNIWGIPYAEAIAATITAIDTFLGAVLQISSASYYKVEAIKSKYEDENEELKETIYKLRTRGGDGKWTI